MSPDLLVELRNFRQILRDLKADNLREYRRYQREGYGAGMPDFMYGMAMGKTTALSRLDLMISVLEESDDTQNV
jgi:hypothetical protein